MPSSSLPPTSEQVSKPGFDPSAALEQLKEIVSSNKEPTTGGGKSWLGTLIILAAVLVGVAIWSWVSFRQGRELAGLRHEKEKTRIRKENEELAAKISESARTIAERQKKIEAADEQLRNIDADIRAAEARYDANLRAIDSIRSWRDAGIGR